MLRPFTLGCCLVAAVCFAEKANCQNSSNLEILQVQAGNTGLPLQGNYSVFSITGSMAQRNAMFRAMMTDPNKLKEQPFLFASDNRVNAPAEGLRIVSRPTFGLAADNTPRVRKIYDLSGGAFVAEGAVKAADLPDYVHAELWDKPYFFKATLSSRADMIFDDVRMGPVYSAASIPVGAPKRVYSDVTTSGTSFSYFRFDAVKPTDMGNAKVVAEAQFYLSSSNVDQFSSDNAVPGQQTTVAFRNLYGQLGGLAAGKGESAFADTVMIPDLVNNSKLFGAVSLVSPSIRYIYSFDPDANFTVSLEQPSSLIGNEVSALDVKGISNAPDLAVRYKQVRPDVGYVQLAGVFRSLGAEGFGAFKPGDAGYYPAARHDDAFGYGVHASSALLLPVNHGDIPSDFVSASGVYGQGVGRYDSDISNVVIGTQMYADGLYNYSTNTLTPLRLFSAVAGYTHFWTSQLRSTAAVGYGDLDTSEDTVRELFRRGYSASVNTFYVVNALTTAKEGDLQNPTAQLTAAQVQIGLELIHGHKEMNNGVEAESNRIQFTVQILK